METPITFKSNATNMVIGGSKQQKIPAKMFCRAAAAELRSRRSRDVRQWRDVAQ